MQGPVSLATILIALAVIFLAITVQDYLRLEGKLTPARHTWLRVAFIFAGVGIVLYVVQTFFR